MKESFLDISNSSINIDLANSIRAISPDIGLGKEFSEHAKEVMEKMFSKNSEQYDVIKNCNIVFCIKDSNDPSVARAMPADDSKKPLNGNDFVIAFTKNLISKLDNEDEFAFILGHEISHILHKKGKNGSFNHDEEIACDLNSIYLMKEAGYNAKAAIDVDDKFYKNFPMPNKKERMDEKKKAVGFCFSEFSPYNYSKYNDIDYVRLEHKFNIPSHKSSEDIQISKMVANLNTVYQKGGGDGFRDMIKNFLNEKPLEDATKFITKLTANVIDKFPTIDKIMEADYNHHFSHPLNVLSVPFSDLANKEGKKMYPAEEIAKINKYLNDNSKYKEASKKFWGDNNSNFEHNGKSIQR